MYIKKRLAFSIHLQLEKINRRLNGFQHFERSSFSMPHVPIAYRAYLQDSVTNGTTKQTLESLAATFLTAYLDNPESLAVGCLFFLFSFLSLPLISSRARFHFRVRNHLPSSV